MAWAASSHHCCAVPARARIKLACALQPSAMLPMPSRHQWLLAAPSHAHRDVGLAAQQVLHAVAGRELDHEPGLASSEAARGWPAAEREHALAVMRTCPRTLRACRALARGDPAQRGHGSTPCLRRTGATPAPPRSGEARCERVKQREAERLSSASNGGRSWCATHERTCGARRAEPSSSHRPEVSDRGPAGASVIQKVL